ncbi:hypothetical protein [Aegicerativicinus sediminis]|uniref:hypothetical protein n=1 Tax=Aegicerativicinus sediminis TaxID=2893202 RepID=UPI001E4986E7|nr:hypothetical protein [Aegicerativicinus sediminis]
MKTILYISVLLTLSVNFYSLSQVVTVKSPIKSVEIFIYKAERENGEIVKGEPYKASFFQDYYPISFESPSMEEYDELGQLKKVCNFDVNREIVTVEKYHYNQGKKLIKFVGFVPKFQDSLVMDWTYDHKGNFETLRVSKQELTGDTWFSSIFGKFYYSKYRDSDCHNFYLSTNDSLNNIKRIEFDSLKLIKDHLYKLYDTANNLVSERELIVKNAFEGTLHPKRWDTTLVRKEYKFNNDSKIKEMIATYMRSRENDGGLKKQKLVYIYTADNKLSEVIDSLEYYPLKAGFTKVKARWLTKKEVHEYLDNGTKHIVSFFDEKDELEERDTEIFYSNDELKEMIREQRNRKEILTYDVGGNLISYIRLNIKKNKKLYDFVLDREYNEMGDWVKCVHIDNLKGRALLIEERVIEYY